MKSTSTFLTLVILFFAALQILNAQPVYRALVAGQIVMKDGKVVTGKIKIQRYENHALQVVFYGDLNVKRIYTAADLKSYSLDFMTKQQDGSFYKERKHFESKPIGREAKSPEPIYAFLEREVEGVLNLFRFYLSSDDDKNPISRVFVEGDKISLFEIQQAKFIDDAKKVFSEYEEMAYAIGSEGFEFKDMTRLVENYNLWLSRR